MLYSFLVSSCDIIFILDTVSLGETDAANLLS